MMQKYRVSVEPVSYMRRALGATILPGVSQILKADGKLRLLYRCLILIICIAIFSFLTALHFSQYRGYDVVSDVQLLRTEKLVELPAFTLCTPDRTQVYKSCLEMCLARNRSNKTQDAVDCDKLTRDLKKSLPQKDEDADKVKLPPLESIFHSCYISAWNSNYFKGRKHCSTKNLRVFSLNAPNGMINVCYTFNSVISWPGKRPDKVYSAATIRLRLKPAVENSSIQVSVHSPYTFLNPHIEGHTLEQGINYEMLIRKEVIERTPPPNEIPCTDYMALWRQRAGSGPTDQQECAQECIANVYLDKHDCIPDFVNWPQKYRACKQDFEDPMLMQPSEECIRQHCPQACLEVRYKIFAQETAINDEDNCDDVEEYDALMYCKNMSADMFGLRLRLNNMETKKYIYSYNSDFMVIKVLCWIGSFTALCLGCSFVQIINFIDILVEILIHYICELRKK